MDFPKDNQPKNVAIQTLNPMKATNVEYDTPTIQEDLSEKLKI